MKDDDDCLDEFLVGGSQFSGSAFPAVMLCPPLQYHSPNRVLYVTSVSSDVRRVFYVNDVETVAPSELGTVESILILWRPPGSRTQVSGWATMFHCSYDMPNFSCVTVSHHACRPYFGNSLDQLLNSDVVSNALLGIRSPQPSRMMREAILRSHGTVLKVRRERPEGSETE